LAYETKKRAITEVMTRSVYLCAFYESGPLVGKNEILQCSATFIFASSWPQTGMLACFLRKPACAMAIRFIQ
jgi:hypothetical protein